MSLGAARRHHCRPSPGPAPAPAGCISPSSTNGSKPYLEGCREKASSSEAEILEYMAYITKDVRTHLDGSS